MIDYTKLYKKYLYKKNELSFTKEVVIEKIMKKFNAKSFSKTEVLDLINDDQLEYSKIFECLVIDDPQVLLGTFSGKEKKYHKEELNDNQDNPLDFKKIKKAEWSYNRLLLDEQEGRRIDIFLESKDGHYISEFIVRDRCEKVNSYLNALIVGALIQTGKAEYPADIENEYFQYYLENLNKNNFLN
ncbi:hypothetical protein H7992_22485 [Sporosarcina sp. resist]|uniref:hypothetical protein n=1 Tax=Sporosarcina sp. resist TaxID=2762563 RepID=UPI00164CE6F1|nr:hypothetical protein [Sporosarcina sp. resist]QNK87892.1 hypothetical protein H7992_22485 [Sporosarcina sp. resist]